MAAHTTRCLVSWSSGKDCAHALEAVRTGGRLEVAGLLTTVTERFARVSMHGVRLELLERQAQAAGVPLLTVPIPWPCPNEVYEERMAEAMGAGRASGVECVVFGDISLEDVREYRQLQLARCGMTGEFPLWGRNTRELACEIVASGLRAVVTCLDPRRLPRSFAGRTYDATFLRDLPDDVDPCGENGEFHTFAVAGPVFSSPVRCTPGEVVERDGFVFADLLAERRRGPQR